MLNMTDYVNKYKSIQKNIGLDSPTLNSKYYSVMADRVLGTLATMELQSRYGERKVRMETFEIKI